MKILQSGGLLLLCALLCQLSFSQHIPINEPDVNKAKLFHDLPDHVSVDVSSLQNLLNLQIGQLTTFQITDNVLLEGIVASAAIKYNTIKSIVIRLTNRTGASFSFSQITQRDGSVKYTGRILSRQNSDGYELDFENGKYILVKKNFYDMVNE
jgi:hypothetical protein